jgi:cytidyltransferase-like protein
MTEVLTIGTFDVPHLGHAYLFQQAARLGDLTVGVNSDAFVEAYKGAPPVYSWAERRAAVASLGYVVEKNDGAGRDLIDRVSPDYLVIGSDWAPPRDYFAQVAIDQEFLDARRITMVYVPRVPGLASSGIRERCR